MIKIKKKSSRRPDIEMKDLLLFWNIIQHGSFGRAGKAMGFSQPKVTRRVRLMEERFGTQLLFRSCRGVALTRSGEHALEMARSIVERVEAMKREAGAEEHGEQGPITVASASGFGHFWLAPVLRRFSALHPGIQIEFKINHSGSIDIMMGEADIVIMSEPVSRRALSCTPLCSYHFCLYASADYIARKGMPETLEDLDHHDLIVWSQGLDVQPVLAGDGLLGLGRPHGSAERTPKVRIQDDVSLMSMVRNGFGLCIAPIFFFEGMGDVVRIPCFENAGIHLKTEGRKYIVCNQKKGIPRRVSALVEFVEKEAASCPLFTNG